MANSCFFNARIAGKKEDVDKVFDFIKEHAYGAEVYDTEEESEYEEDFYVSGEVKWIVVLIGVTAKALENDFFLSESRQKCGFLSF